jgi:hypothetical protein
MEKEFVPYDLSLRMKQLGFDEPCFGWYLPEIVDKGNAASVILGSYLTKWNKFEDRLSAPLYQQAFRWFREEHNLFILMQVGQHNGEYQTFYFNVIEYGVNKYKSLFRSETSKYTHEEAQLACLRKLIEIVEEKPKQR